MRVCMTRAKSYSWMATAWIAARQQKNRQENQRLPKTRRSRCVTWAHLWTVPHTVEALAAVDVDDMDCCKQSGRIVGSIGDCQKRGRSMEPEPPASLSSTFSQVLPECVQAERGVSCPQQRLHGTDLIFSSWIGYLPGTNLESAAFLSCQGLQAPSAQLARAGTIHSDLSTSFY